MRADRFGAGERGRDEGGGHLQQVRVLVVGLGDRRRESPPAPAGDDGCRVREPGRIAHESGVAPHQLLQGGPAERDPHGTRFGRRRGSGGAPGEARGVRPRSRADVGGHRVAGARAEHGALEQRVRREPVGAVHARAGDLAHGVEVRHARASGQVGRHPAHQVVRRGLHRDRLARPVVAALPHRRIDRRKAGREERRRLLARGAEPGHVEQHGLAVLRRHHLGDRPRHDIARGELRIGVHLEHEPAPLLVAENRALATDRLRHEERRLRRAPWKHRRVELDELQIDHRGARAEGRGDAVAGRHGRVRRVRVELPSPAGREDHRVGRDPLAHRRRPVAHEQIDPDDATCLDDEVAQERLLDDPHRGGPHARDERPLDRAPRGIPAGVQHPRVGVGRLEALHEPAGGLAVERDAPRDQLADARRALVDQHARRLGVGQPRAGDEGVAQVRRRAVVVEHHAGDPALREAGVRVLERVFRHEGDATSGCHGVQRRRQSGDARADDHDRGAVGGPVAGTSRRPTGEAAHGFAASMRSSATRAGSATSPGTVMRLTTRPATSSSSTQAR